MGEKEKLNELKVHELLAVAKNLRIKNRHNMSKGELIHNIVKVQKADEEYLGLDSKSMVKIGQATAAGFIEGMNGTKKNAEQYLEMIQPGTIIAVKIEKFGKTKYISAAFQNINRQKKIIKVITSYGVEHVVEFKNVLWVKTGKRWPKHVFELLRGVSEAEKCIR